MLIGQPDAHESAPRELEVPAPIPNVRLPTIVGKAAVSLNDEATLDNHVHAPDPVNRHLKLAVQACLPQNHAQHTLRPRLGPTVNQRAQTMKARRQTRKYRGEVLSTDELLKHSVVEGCHSVPRVLAPCGLGKGIHNAHGCLGCFFEKWQPMESSAKSVFASQGHVSGSRTS